MAQSLHKTKRRIASINSTKKITKAMELVSTVKLRKFRRLMDENARYANEIAALMVALFERLGDEVDETYTKEGKGEKDLYLVLHSDFGLCAAYNNNIFNFVKTNVPKDKTKLLPIGTKGEHPYFNEGYDVDLKYLPLGGHIDTTEILKLGRELHQAFIRGEYRSIHLVYTHYVNSLKFVPMDATLFPIQVHLTKPVSFGYPPIFDPNVKTLINELVPVYVNGVLFQRIIESLVSEQTARRTAMENASDNADELIDKLTLEYNKARQTMITQEISEIVGGQQ